MEKRRALLSTSPPRRAWRGGRAGDDAWPRSARAPRPTSPPTPCVDDGRAGQAEHHAADGLRQARWRARTESWIKSKAKILPQRL